jgi:hypothetical protein
VLSGRRATLFFPISYPDFQDYRKLTAAFTDVAAYTPSPVNFRADGRPERAWAELVTGNYFSMFGLQAALGRLFTGDEGWVPGKNALVVLSHKYSQERFGGTFVIGQPVHVNQHLFTIIESLRIFPRCLLFS